MREIATRLVYGGFNRVLRLECVSDHGSQFSREVVARAAAVAVLLLSPDESKVVLVSQWRAGAHVAGVSPFMTEIVAGAIDGAESIWAAASREALEETGCTISAGDVIAKILPSPGFSSEVCTVLYAFVTGMSDASDGGIVGDGEATRRLVLDAAEAASLLERDGECLGAPTAVALTWLKCRRLNFGK